MPEIAEADKEALDGINSGLEWKDVHVAWELKTHRALSPSAFGKYILSFSSNSGSRSERAPQHQHQHSLQSPVSTQTQEPRVKPAALPPVHKPQPPSSKPPQYQTPQHQPAQPDSLESQRNDISRIDGAVTRLQMEMREVRQILEIVRRDMHTRITSPHTTDDDSNTLEALSATVSSVSSKAGEVDGLRFHMETLKRRIKKLEDLNVGVVGTLAPPTPSPHEGPHPPVIPAHRHYPSPLPPTPQLVHPSPPQPPTSQPGGWNAVNSSTKRKSSSDEAGFDTTKRARTSVHGSFIHENGGLAAHPAAPPPIQTGPSNREIRQLPQNHHHMPIQPGIHYYGEEAHNAMRLDEQARSARANGGRPRKSSPLHLSTAAWHGEAPIPIPMGTEISPDGHGRPVSGGPRSTVSPTASDGPNGRQSAGGILLQIDYGAKDGNKRTRQRPFRNADGVLIRKDGKPDQRSISSPMNLKKVHATKKVGDGEGGADAASSPMGNTMSPDEDKDSALSITPQEDDKRAILDRQAQMLHSMFPNGKTPDTDSRMYADMVLSGAKLQSPADLHKERPTISTSALNNSDRTSPISTHRKENAEERRLPGDVNVTPVEQTAKPDHQFHSHSLPKDSSPTISSMLTDSPASKSTSSHTAPTLPSIQPPSAPTSDPSSTMSLAPRAVV